jgi:hypothetical protein
MDNKSRYADYLKAKENYEKEAREYKQRILPQIKEEASGERGFLDKAIDLIPNFVSKFQATSAYGDMANEGLKFGIKPKMNTQTFQNHLDKEREKAIQGKTFNNWFYQD